MGSVHDRVQRLSYQVYPCEVILILSYYFTLVAMAVFSMVKAKTTDDSDLIFFWVGIFTMDLISMLIAYLAGMR